MYGKNHYNTVISLQLIKNKWKKKEYKTNTFIAISLSSSYTENV